MNNPAIDSANKKNLVCEVKGLDPSGKVGLTVGDVFALECPTESFVLNPSKLKFETKKKYQLEILGTQLHPDGRLQLKVTSYQVGEFNGESLKLTDGVSEIEVEGVHFKVESVIDRQNPPKDPYGPFGGFVLGLPLLYLWLGISILAMAGSIVAFKFWRRWQRKRLIENLKKHDSRLSPQTQLHVRFRQLERDLGSGKKNFNLHLKEVEDILRLFIIRQFRIPAYDWSDRLIVSDFRKRFAFFGEDLLKDLFVLLREVEKMKAVTSPSEKDTEQLVRKIKKWADRIDRLTRQQQRQSSGVLPGVFQ